ncbi:protein of unknown function [Caballeronia sp. S22]
MCDRPDSESRFMGSAGAMIQPCPGSINGSGLHKGNKPNNSCDIYVLYIYRIFTFKADVR